MCGIAATLLQPGKCGEECRDEIWRLFTANLHANEERGNAATGIAVVQDSGERLIWKVPVSATEFLRRSEASEARAAFDSATICLIGHTRLPTRGAVENPSNNHPIEYGAVVGVHNGTIRNDDILFERMNRERAGEVDSEAIFALLDSIPGGLDGSAYGTAVASAIGDTEGSLTVLAMDSRRPREALVLKRDMPLSMHYDGQTGALHLSSRYLFLRKAFGRAVVLERMESSRGYLFDVEKLGTGHKPWASAFPLTSHAIPRRGE